MSLVETIISVSGFSQTEAQSGVSDLLAEFQQRLWIICPAANWDVENGRLVVTVCYEGDDPEGCARGVLDEVGDCVSSCFPFPAAGLHFAVDKSSVVSGT